MPGPICAVSCGPVVSTATAGHHVPTTLEANYNHTWASRCCLTAAAGAFTSTGASLTDRSRGDPDLSARGASPGPAHREMSPCATTSVALKTAYLNTARQSAKPVLRRSSAAKDEALFYHLDLARRPTTDTRVA